MLLKHLKALFCYKKGALKMQLSYIVAFPRWSPLTLRSKSIIAPILIKHTSNYSQRFRKGILYIPQIFSTLHIDLCLLQPIYSQFIRVIGQYVSFLYYSYSIANIDINELVKTAYSVRVRCGSFILFKISTCRSQILPTNVYTLSWSLCCYRGWT